jgi:uncharacterized protein (DUF488 family)
MVVYTVGHGTKTSEQLTAVLLNARVAKLVDVRRHPGSRRHPHFSKEQLEQSMPRAAIEYEWWGESLGGRRRDGRESRHPAWRNASFRAYADHMDSDEFRSAIQELERAAGARVTAVMCSETLWWNCHRRLIADALTLRGSEVVHIMGLDKLQPHKLHPAIRKDDEGWPVYDVGETRSLI